METKRYLIGTHVGGLMEMTDYRFTPPYNVIEASTEIDATRLYNKRNNCSYFYGGIMCVVTDDGQCVEIDRSTSRQKCEEILKSL